MDSKRDTIIALDLVSWFLGEINGIKFKITEDPGTYWDPPNIDIEILEGEFLIRDDEYDVFLDDVLYRVQKGDYIVPEEVEVAYKKFIEWENSMLDINNE